MKHALLPFKNSWWRHRAPPQETYNRPVQLRRFVGDAAGQLARQFRVRAAGQLLRVSRDRSQRIAESEREFGGNLLMQLLIVPDPLKVGLVGQQKSCPHETRVFGENGRGRHFKDTAFSIPSEVIHDQSSNRRLSRESGRKRVLDA